MSSMRRSVTHRYWIPGFAILGFIIIAGGVWAIPGEAPLDANRRFYSIMAGLVASLIVVLWFFLLSSFAWWIRGTAFLLLAGLGFSTTQWGRNVVRNVELTGDMEPILDFGWQRDRRGERDEYLAGANTVTNQHVDLSTTTATDVPEFRGPRRDGVVPGPALDLDWASRPPEELWKHPIGGGYSSWAVVGPWAVTQEQRGEDEAVVCYDIRTGDQAWVYRYPALFTERMGGDGPRATPTIVAGRVYSLGATGILVCLDGATGQRLWHVNVLDTVHAANLEWGMAGSPLVLDDKVVVCPGVQKAPGPSASVVAFNAADGSVAWKSGEHQAGYSSPMMAKLSGAEQILVFDGRGISGYLPGTGESLWRYGWKSDYDVNAVQPLVVGDDKVLISSNSGAALLTVKKDESGNWQARPVWSNRNMKCDYSSPILHGGHVYGLDVNILACVDVNTGERAWKGGRYGHGQILLRGKTIVVLSEKGMLALVEARPDKFVERAKLQAIEGKTWNVPVLVGDVLLARNHLEMAAFKLPLAPTP